MSRYISLTTNDESDVRSDSSSIIVNNPANANLISAMILAKIVNNVETTSCFHKKFLTKKWTACTKNLMWISRRHLHNDCNEHMSFIDILVKINIGSKCDKYKLDTVMIFIMKCIESATLHEKHDYQIAETNFIRSTCLEILKCTKVENKIKFGNIDILEIQ